MQSQLSRLGMIVIRWGRSVINRSIKGDTLVEVILAVTVFSMVAVGTISIMNKGVAIAQHSLEISLVRQQIDAQAEMLRYIHDERNNSTAHLWNDLKKPINLVAAASVKQRLGVTSCPDKFEAKEFALRSLGGNIQKVSSSQQAQSYAKVEGDVSYGVSIQLTKGSKFYDAYIQACWDSLESSMPATMGTIVRLYDQDA